MGKILGLFIWLKGRLSEPSTHASLAAVAAMAGVNVDPGVIQDWLNVGTLVFGSIGFFVKEKEPETKL